MTQAEVVAGVPTPTEPAAPDDRPGFTARHPLGIFVCRRLLASVLLLLFVSVLVFLATMALPGDIAAQILGRRATPESLEALRQQLGTNAPLWQQYVDWLSGLLHGDLGNSLTSKLPISEMIGDRLVNSFYLALVTMVIMVPLGVILGTVAGLRARRPLDHGIMISSLVAISIPDFVIATLLALVFAITLGWLPATSLLPAGETPLGNPTLLVLPVVTLLIVGSAYVVRMVRTGVIEVMDSEYVQMARLNGVPERTVVWRYGLRNSLAPTIQVTALTLQWLIGGVIIVETVFAFPGIGLSLVQAVQVRDFHYVQSVAMILAAVFVVINLLADLAVVLVVPKLRSNPS